MGTPYTPLNFVDFVPNPSLDAANLTYIQNGIVNATNTANKAVPSGYVLSPSGDTTGATDLANFNAAISATMATAATIALAPGHYYVNGPIVIKPGNSGTNNVPAPVPSIISLTGAGHIGDMSTDTAAVIITAAGSYPAGQFLLDYQENGTEYAGTGAVVRGIVLDCNSLGAGFRAIGPRKFHVSDLSIIKAAAPTNAVAGETGAFSITPQTSGTTDGGAYNLFENISIDQAATDSFFHQSRSQDTFVNCQSLDPGQVGFHLNGSDATFIGCGYEGGVTAVQLHTSCTSKFYGLDSYAGSTSFPTGNAVIIDAGEGSSSVRYPAPKFTGCHFGNNPASSTTEQAGAVVNIKQYSAGLVQNATFTGCSFSAGTYTTDWVYVEASITGSVRITDAEFRGTVTTNQWNDLSGIVQFSRTSGLTIATAGQQDCTADTAISVSTPTDITGTSATMTTTNGYLLVQAMFDLNCTAAGVTCAGYLNVDGSNQSEQVLGAVGGTRWSMTGTWVVPVASGSHTIKLQGAVVSGTGTATFHATHTRVTWQFVTSLT